MGWDGPRYTEQGVRDAVAGSRSLSDALRALGLRAAGSNFLTLKRLIQRYDISTEHLDPNWVLRGDRPNRRIPFDQVMVEGSSYGRDKLKRRLYEAGLKQPRCELCGTRWERSRDPKPESRKVERPPYEQLMADLAVMSVCAVGRTYGVSDNAVRKWVRWYRAEQERAAGRMASAPGLPWRAGLVFGRRCDRPRRGMQTVAGSDANVERALSIA